MTNDRADSFLRMIRRSQRGRLKVYLGYCAGVGKTYQMLQEGHRLKADGVDAVVGFVETHGRAETAALLDGLETIPRLRQEYRGVPLEEMDVDAILARKPAVALIDELAHTNVPGSRNAKRYEDVQDILDVGIHVVTTLNVQHLESLYNTVEAAVSVKVRERLPDSVLAGADQIVNVDLATEDLQRRLREGKIYSLDRVETALGNFFVHSNLEQLREITLRELASQIDLRRREPEEEESGVTADQVVVCLSSGGPNSEMLLRYASRLAGRLNRNWYALYVQTPSEEPTVIDAETQRILASALTLAKQLGAMVFTYKGEDVAETILRFAREYRVGHIVVGTPAPISAWDRIRGKRTVVEHLMLDAEGATIIVLDTRQTKNAGRETRLEEPQTAPPQSTPHAPQFAGLLSPRQILIWDNPVSKGEALYALARAALGEDDPSLFAEALPKILAREQQSSTFFNEGAAFPHARLDRLSGPRLALGLTRGGIADVTTEKPIEAVFLILTSVAASTTQLQILALASRAAQNRSLLQHLSSTASAEDALKTLLDWEDAE